jgi:uncharacterized protein
MTNPRKPLRLNVGFIVSQEVGYTHEFPFDYEKIQVADDLDLRHFRGAVHIGRTQQGLLVTAQFEADLDLKCVRCLRTFEHTVRWEMTEVYAFSKKSETDSELILPESMQLDLAPLVRDDALLQVPISPICQPDCRGLCPVCGQNLNLKDCGHRADEGDSPFSVLKDLLKN